MKVFSQASWLADGFDPLKTRDRTERSLEDFTAWARGGDEPWWFQAADCAPRPDWYLRLQLASGTGNVILQGQSKRIALNNRKLHDRELFLPEKALQMLVLGRAFLGRCELI